MPETTLTFTLTEDLYGRLADRLRHTIQYAEAARITAEEALAVLESEPKVESDDA